MCLSLLQWLLDKDGGNTACLKLCCSLLEVDSGIGETGFMVNKGFWWGDALSRVFLGSFAFVC